MYKSRSSRKGKLRTNHCTDVDAYTGSMQVKEKERARKLLKTLNYAFKPNGNKRSAEQIEE